MKIDQTPEHPNDDLSGPSILWIYFFGLIILIQIITLIIMPVVYDTIHLNDTLFILNEASRIFRGLEPGVDYGSFFPGFTPRVIALAFSFTGPTVNALDVAPLLNLAIITPITVLIFYKRLGPFSSAAMAALITTCLLTRAPFEAFPALTHIVSAHSSYYNRIGLACALLILVFVLVPLKDKRIFEYVGGFGAGFAMAIALMSKWSFSFIFAAVLAALAIQKRGNALFSFVTGTLILWIFLDPFGSNFFGSFNYMINTASSSGYFGGISSAIIKSANLVFWNLWPVSIFTVIFFITIPRIIENFQLTWLFSYLVISIVISINLVVMGPFKMVGHQILPLVCALSIICFEQVRALNSKEVNLTRVLSGFLLMGLLIPHALNSLVVTNDGMSKQNESTIIEGPMKGYVMRTPFPETKSEQKSIIEKASQEIALHGGLTESSQYAAFIDGAQALASIGDLSHSGIISGSSLNFEFTLGSRPVTGFPLWLLPSSPELINIHELPKDGDILILLKDGELIFRNLLQPYIESNFRLCVSTKIWDIYIRTTEKNFVCSM